MGSVRGFPASQHPTDWQASVARRQDWQVAAGWVLAASVVFGLLAGAAALTRWLDLGAGQRAAQDDALLLDLPPLPPPSLSAVADVAPDTPTIDPPESPEPPDVTDTLIDPAVAPPLPVAPLPPMTPPQPDARAEAAAADLPPERLAPPQPALLAAAPMADLPPDSLAAPPPAPLAEPVVKPAPKPVTRPETKREIRREPVATTAKPPAPAQVSANAHPRSDPAAEAAASVSSGRVKDLKATWGAAIRKKIERRKSYPKAAGDAAGTATVRLSVTRKGGLSAVSLVRSSGNAALDQAALSAVRTAGGFPAAPAELTDPSYVFTLPINYAR